MAEKIKDLKKLSPKERIKKLKDLQEKDKKEIEEAQKLIKESEEEATKEDELRKIPVPQLKAVNIDDLFSPEERELFSSYKFLEKKAESVEEALETKVKEEKIDIPETERERIIKEEQERVVQYGKELSEKPAQALYKMATDIKADVQNTGYISQDQQNKLASIEYAENKKMKDIRSGKYALDSEAAGAMVMTQRIKDQLQEKYEAGTTYKRAT